MGVPDMGHSARTSDVESFAWFFTSEYPQVVRLLTVVLHDAAAAEDLAQDAFVRLYRHWAKVSRYESPEAWVRRVALTAPSPGDDAKAAGAASSSPPTRAASQCLRRPPTARMCSGPCGPSRSETAPWSRCTTSRTARSRRSPRCSASARARPGRPAPRTPPARRPARRARRRTHHRGEPMTDDTRLDARVRGALAEPRCPTTTPPARL